MSSLFFKRALTMSLLVLLASGCGKDEKSSSSPAPKAEPVVAPDPVVEVPSVPSQPAFTNFKAWYKSSSTEGSLIVAGTWTEHRVIKTYSTSSNCTNQDVNVFGLNLGTINYCFSSSTPSTSTSETRDLTIPGIAKSENEELTKVYTGDDGDLTLVNSQESANPYGTIYTIEFSRADNSRVVYVIDTSINSAFNPVYISDSAARTEESVVGID